MVYEKKTLGILQKKLKDFPKKLKDLLGNSMLRRLPASVGLQKNVQKICLNSAQNLNIPKADYYKLYLRFFDPKQNIWSN